MPQIKDERPVREEIIEILNDWKRDTKTLDLLFNKKGIDALVDYVKSTYIIGLKDGVEMYAWMKEGVYYVGTTGRTLKEAKLGIDKDFRDGKYQPK